jgi:hypothetical protein
MRFTLEEAKNLIKMLRSSDEENHHVAFEAIKQSDLSDINTLLFLYKFGKRSDTEWQTYCYKPYTALRVKLKFWYELEDIKNAECLWLFTNSLKAPIDMVEAAVEYSVEALTDFLKLYNYKKVDIQVKLEK